MKRRIFAYLAVAAASLLFIPSASATWSGFRSLGKTPVVGEPSCVQVAASEVMCVARSQASTLMANEFSKGAWSGWANLSGAVTSDASCVNNEAGDIVCGVITAKGTLAAVVFNGTTWGSPIDSGQAIASSPSCAFLHSGKVLCGARSETSSLIASVFNGSWGKFSTQTAQLVSAPSCTSDDDGNVICAALAMVSGNNSYIANLFDGSKWQGFLTLNGWFLGNPFCLPFNQKGSVEGVVGCLSYGFNTVAWGSSFNGNGWNIGDWNCNSCIQLTGNILPTFSCALLSPGSVTCAFINGNRDHLMYENTFNGSQWTGYVKVGGPPITAGPSCASYSSGKAMCVVVGLNNQASSVIGP